MYIILGLPVLADSAGVVQCSVTKKDTIGDHHVWYGRALEAVTSTDDDVHPMLYYQR